MNERLPSLDLLLDLVRAERDHQVEHADALDNKAGVVLAFSGLLITLSPGVDGHLRLLAVLGAAGAALAALLAFWPRPYPVFEASRMRRYIAAEDRFTRLTVLDTMIMMMERGADLIRRKWARLRVSFILLTTSAILFSLGIVMEGI